MPHKNLLDFIGFWYNSNMSKKQLSTRISPEGLRLQTLTWNQEIFRCLRKIINGDEAKVSEFLAKREAKHTDQVYLDTGYRNRFKLAEVLDTLIDAKLEEAEESEIYTNKDLADLVQMAHKIRVDELESTNRTRKSKSC